MAMKKTVALMLALILIMGMFAGCGSKKEDSMLAEKNETETVSIGVSRDSVRGPGDTFYCWEGSYVWESLTINRGGVIDPLLAEKWEHNDDCTEWTFYLRKGVKFHDGEDFNVDAVMANIKRWDKGIGSTYTSLNTKKCLPNLDQMIKVDDTTIKFTFTKPITTLEYLLADYGSPMVSPKCFDAETGAINAGIGTGPYVIKEHEEDQYVLLERNENYWGQKALVKNIKLVYIASAEGRYSALVSNEVQGLADNGAITMASAYNLCQSNDEFAMDSTKSHMSEYLLFNFKNEYLANKELRQAMSMIIDRELINNTLYSGLATPGYSFLSNQSMFHYDVKGEYDVEKAKSLAAGVMNGKTVEMTMIINSSKADEYNLKPVAEYLKEVWKPLGIDLKIEILQSKMYTQRQKDKDYDMFLSVTGLNNADPASTFETWFKSTGSSNVQYGMGFSDAKVDELISKAPTIVNVEDRVKVYNELQQYLYDEAAHITLNYHINVNIHNVAIDGYAGQTIGVNLPGIHWVK